MFVKTVNREQILRPQIVYGPIYNFKKSIGEDEVIVSQLPHGWVSDSLCYEVENWTPEVSVGIFSDTGTGKNTFFETVLIPKAQRRGLKILYLSNRNALGRQQKNRLAGLFDEEYKLERYTDQGLDAVTDFGCVKAVSYQQLEAWIVYGSPRLQDLLEEQFLYVIVDEAHYFLSDSAFNALTDLSLSFVTTNFRESIRIYMTATPEEIFPLLKEREQGDGEVVVGRCRYTSCSWRIYQFEHSFKGILPHAFHLQRDLTGFISNAEGGKTVVFVDSKGVGETLLNILKNSVLITAESKIPGKPGYETYRKIVDTEKFEEDVLISTAVLENGVNIKDPEVQRVVIFSDDKTRFLQMLGRIRREEGQEITLLLPEMTNQDVTRKVNQCQLLLEACESYKKDASVFYKDFISMESSVPIRNAFTVLPDGKTHLNRLAHFKLKYYDLPYYERLKSAMEGGDDYAGLQAKFHWVGAEFGEAAFIQKQAVEDAFLELMWWLEEQIDQEIPKEKQQEFCTGFSRQWKAAFGDRQEDKSKGQTYGLSIIRQLMEKKNFPYRIDNPRGYWILRRKRKEMDENA